MTKTHLTRRVSHHNHAINQADNLLRSEMAKSEHDRNHSAIRIAALALAAAGKKKPAPGAFGGKNTAGTPRKKPIKLAPQKARPYYPGEMILDSKGYEYIADKNGALRSFIRVDGVAISRRKLRMSKKARRRERDRLKTQAIATAA